MNKHSVPLKLLLKGVIIVSSPALLIMALYVILGALSITHFLYAYIGILAMSTVFLHPFLANVSALTDYVVDLTQDKKVGTPDLGFLSAMTELTQALEQLHSSWEKKKQQMENIITEREILVDSLPDILVMVNDAGVILRTNKAARTLFGQNLAGKQIRNIILSDVLHNSMAAVSEDMQRREFEIHLTEPEQMDFRVVIERFPIPTPGGISLVVTLNDVTALKRVQKMRADFVANASHEIRTPLASIAGFVETLRGPAKDDEVARDEFLKIISEQATRMNTLINDLLSLSKIEMNAHTIPSGSVDVMRLVRNEKENLKWLAEGKRVNIALNFNDNLPFARAEESELRQVIYNLLSNAIKYGQSDSTVTVMAKVTSALPADPHFIHRERAIVLSFIDQGEGIPKEHLPRLTERFYRVDSARSRTVGGTGLGLAIVKHIIFRHRGVLTIDSEVGVGSNFSVYLPIFEDN